MKAEVLKELVSLVTSLNVSHFNYLFDKKESVSLGSEVFFRFDTRSYGDGFYQFELFFENCLYSYYLNDIILFVQDNNLIMHFSHSADYTSVRIV